MIAGFLHHALHGGIVRHTDRRHLHLRSHHEAGQDQRYDSRNILVRGVALTRSTLGEAVGFLRLNEPKHPTAFL